MCADDSSCSPPDSARPDEFADADYVRGMERLLQAVQELSLARSLPDVQQVVRTSARELTGCDGATFVLRDKGMCYYADEDAIAPLWMGSRFPMENCISGWAMLNREAAVIPNIYRDARIPHAAYRPTFVKSMVMVPIRKLDPIGAIGNYWAHTSGSPPSKGFPCCRRWPTQRRSPWNTYRSMPNWNSGCATEPPNWKQPMRRSASFPSPTT
jgi:GAF domain-containing protein